MVRASTIFRTASLRRARRLRSSSVASLRLRPERSGRLRSATLAAFAPLSLRSLWLASFVLLLAACGEDTTVRDDATDATTSTDDTIVDATADIGDVGDAADVEILFVGYPCSEDELCSTGLCYGKATLQGHFEDAECQAKCLPTFDFDHYCNSDADCCKGTCCVGCPGGQNGLCVLTPGG